MALTHPRKHTNTHTSLIGSLVGCLLLGEGIKQQLFFSTLDSILSTYGLYNKRIYYP